MLRLIFIHVLSTELKIVEPIGGEKDGLAVGRPEEREIVIVIECKATREFGKGPSPQPSQEDVSLLLTWRRRYANGILYWRDEAIASLGERLNLPRCLWIVAQSLPEFFDCRAEALLKVHERVRRPEFSAELIPADHLAGVVQQLDENLKWLLLELDARSLLSQFPAREIHFENSESENHRRLMAFLHRDISF
jgi:hypothetical protein